MKMGAKEAVKYCAWVVAFSTPLWLVGAWIDAELLPGLPASAVTAAVPAMAAVVLTLRGDGARAARALLARAGDFQIAGTKLLVVAALNPLLFGTTFLIARAIGVAAPAPDWSLARVGLLLALFAPAALLEELGWSGYALDRLRSAYGAVAAATAVGAMWAIWHYPALIQAGRSWAWIAWWSLWTISARVIMARIYDWSGKSVCAAALYHAASNLCWRLYPIDGSYFDPSIAGLTTLGAALLAAAWPRRRRRNDLSGQSCAETLNIAPERKRQDLLARASRVSNLARRLRPRGSRRRPN